MGQRSTYVDQKDVEIMPSKEEFASGTEQGESNAASEDAQIYVKQEECAKGMGQRGNDAEVKDAQIKSSKGGYVLSTEQRSNAAAVKDAQTELLEEACVAGMGPIAIQTRNQLHSDQNLNWPLQLNRNKTSLLLNLPPWNEVEEAFPER